MAMFKKKETQAAPSKRKAKAQTQAQSADAVQAPAREAFCRICEERTKFSKCWRRVNPVRQCPTCKTQFQNVAALYQEFQPACPKCGEFLECPGFEYGLCDKCQSRYELVSGTKPGLLPNQQQRKAMDRVGKARWRK